MKELVAAKERDGASKRHVDDLRSRLNIFAEKFNDQPVATITSAEIDDWLRSLKECFAVSVAGSSAVSAVAARGAFSAAIDAYDTAFNAIEVHTKRANH